MKPFDITLSDGRVLTLLYPGDRTAHMQQEDYGESSLIPFGLPGSYSGGTHIVRPRQRFAPETGLDDVDLHSLIGISRVIDLGDIDDVITHEHLKQTDIRPRERILLKTAHSHRDRGDYAGLTEDAVAYLASRGIEVFGIDAPVVHEKAYTVHKEHRTLPHHGVNVLEGLDLSRVTPGEYFMTVLPEASAGGSRVPARVVLSSL